MMRLALRDGTGALLATTEVVLPVSKEMSCRACQGDVLACPSPGYHVVWYSLSAGGPYVAEDLDCAAGGRQPRRRAPVDGRSLRLTTKRIDGVCP
jgi:hypothetical protein